MRPVGRNTPEHRSDKKTKDKQKRNCFTKKRQKQHTQSQKKKKSDRKEDQNTVPVSKQIEKKQTNTTQQHRQDETGTQHRGLIRPCARAR
jgi:hypothetical protein